MTPDPQTLDVEAAVTRAFSIPMSARSRAFVDGRVDAAVAGLRANRGRTSHDRGFRARPRRLLLGVVAAVLFTGTVVAGGTIFSRLIAGGPLLENVWDRAAQIGQSRTDAGYTIVLERAAADPDRVWVALSVTAAPGTGTDVGRMRVIDANGVVMDGSVGVGILEGDVSASLFGFKVPDGITPDGPFTLEVTSVISAAGESPGRWVFVFDVPLTSAAY